MMKLSLLTSLVCLALSPNLRAVGVIEPLPFMVKRANAVVVADVKSREDTEVTYADGPERVTIVRIVLEVKRTLKGSLLKTGELELLYFTKYENSEMPSDGNFIWVKAGKEYVLFLE